MTTLGARDKNGTEVFLELGDTAKDAISGFEGIVVAITQWLYGCRECASRRITIQPQTLTKDGEPQKNACFDEPQCVLVKTVTQKTKEAFLMDPWARATGGPRPSPTRHADPTR